MKRKRVEKEDDERDKKKAKEEEIEGFTQEEMDFINKTPSSEAKEITYLLPDARLDYVEILLKKHKKNAEIVLALMLENGYEKESDASVSERKIDVNKKKNVPEDEVIMIDNNNHMNFNQNNNNHNRDRSNNNNKKKNNARNNSPPFSSIPTSILSTIPNTYDVSRSWYSEVNFQKFNSIFFVDLDNWGCFFRKCDETRVKISEKSFFITTFSATFNSTSVWDSQMCTTLLNNGQLVNLRCETNRKDSADFKICLLAGILHALISDKRVPFTIISGDKGFFELQSLKKEREINIIAPHNQEDLITYTKLLSLGDR